MNAKPHKLRTIGVDKIPNDTRFVAIYSDCSGAMLFYLNKNGCLFEAEGYAWGHVSNQLPQELLDSGFLFWIPLPANFRLWFEHKEKKP